jgi:hypothetical protein
MASIQKEIHAFPSERGEWLRANKGQIQKDELKWQLLNVSALSHILLPMTLRKVGSGNELDNHAFAGLRTEDVLRPAGGVAAIEGYHR